VHDVAEQVNQSIAYIRHEAHLTEKN